MLEINEKNHIDYLVKISKKKPLSVEEMRKNFIKSFNHEAETWDSEWRAEILHKHLHISKFEESGWWIFKTKERTEDLHIGSYNKNHYYSFIDNDYINSEYGQKKSDKFFKLLPEFKQILIDIPEYVFILLDNSISSMNKHISDITDDIRKIERKI